MISTPTLARLCSKLCTATMLLMRSVIFRQAHYLQREISHQYPTYKERAPVELGGRRQLSPTLFRHHLPESETQEDSPWNRP